MIDDSPLYKRCEDTECPFSFAYRNPFPEVPHYHYVGPKEPAESVWDIPRQPDG